MVNSSTIIAETISKMEAVFNNDSYTPEEQYSLASDLYDALRDALEDVFSFDSSPVKQMFSSLFDGLKDRLSSTTDSIKEKLSTVTSGIRSKLQSLNISLLNGLSTVKNGITNKVTDLKDGIISTYNKATNTIKANLLDVKDTLALKLTEITSTISTSFSSTINKLLQPLKDLGYRFTSSIKELKDKISSKVDSMVTAFKDSVYSFGEKIKNKITSFIETFKGNMSRFSDQVKEMYDGVKNRLTSAGEYVKQKYTQLRKDLSSWIENVWSGIWTFIDDIREKHIKPFLQGGLTFLNKWSAFSEKVRNGEYGSFEELFNDAGGLFGNEEFGGKIGSLIKFFNMYKFIAEKEMLPHIRALEANLNASQQLQGVDVSALLKALIFGDIDENKFKDEMAWNGINSDRADIYKTSIKNLPSKGEAQIAFLRGIIDEKTHDEYLRKAGYSASDIDLFKQLYFVLPPISDIITFAVREVFTPETVEKFGQYEDFPPEFAQFAKQAGLTEQWAKAYWAAHWDLPSPQMGFEMFQRRIIDSDTLKMLLKALDIMPFWREKLIELSYNPLTRVDVRRMYGLGVLTEDEVYESYLDIGYSPENANRLKDFTVRYESKASEDEMVAIRLLTKSVYINAYRRDVYTEQELLDALISMGYVDNDAMLIIELEKYDKYVKSQPVRKEEYYKRLNEIAIEGYKRKLYDREETLTLLLNSNFSENDAEIELDFIDYEVAEKRKVLILEAVKEQYIKRVINNVELVETLNGFGFDNGEIQTIVSELNIIRSIRFRKPTLADLRKFLENRIIDADEFVNELKGLGYPDRYIDWYYLLYVGVE